MVLLATQKLILQKTDCEELHHKFSEILRNNSPYEKTVLILNKTPTEIKNSKTMVTLTTEQILS